MTLWWSQDQKPTWSPSQCLLSSPPGALWSVDGSERPGNLHAHTHTHTPLKKSHTDRITAKKEWWGGAWRRDTYETVSHAPLFTASKRLRNVWEHRVQAFTFHLLHISVCTSVFSSTKCAPAHIMRLCGTRGVEKRTVTPRDKRPCVCTWRTCFSASRRKPGWISAGSRRKRAQ